MKHLVALLFVLTPLACGGGAAAPEAEETEAHHPTPADHASHGDGDGHGDGHAHGPGDGDEGPIGHRFENAEEWVERFEGPDRDAWQKPEHVIDLLAIEAGMTVADIGAGTGYFLPHLSAAVGTSGKVLGLDIEPSMVRYMTARAERERLSNVEAREVAGDDPGMGDGSVDRILIVNTWHHIPDREAYAAKLAAALREGGAVYVVDFTMDSEHGPPRSHRLLPDAVAGELAAGGLETEVLAGEQLPDQYVVVGRKP